MYAYQYPPVLAIIRPGDRGEQQVGVLHGSLLLIVHQSTLYSKSKYKGQCHETIFVSNHLRKSDFAVLLFWFICLKCLEFNVVLDTNISYNTEIPLE